MSLVGLDFETYSDVSLPDYGLDRYVNSPHFRVLKTSIHDGVRALRFDLNDSFEALRDLANSPTLIAAHNAGFERAVLKRMGLRLPARRFIDTAVNARAYGAGGSLEAAAAQLMNKDKMEDGLRLIKLFSVPTKDRVDNNQLEWDATLPSQHPADWSLFGDYCDLDAQLSYTLAALFPLQEREYLNSALTMEMNEVGWPVDVKSVEEMQRRYLTNLEKLEHDFRVTCSESDLNINSHKQLKEWCAARGVRMTSFDEQHVASATVRITKRMANMDVDTDQYRKYLDVYLLLKLKQELGGSSLKKLKTILDTVGEDGRLRDQYLHAGAQQTLRTTGRSVQMQNLKRLNGPPSPLEHLTHPKVIWSNDLMASNLRQVFTSSDPNGELIVGDLASIESRGLAWQANADWKKDAFRTGKDLYKVQASAIFGVPYDQITPDQRQTGKVGELSCGYQAGPDAVRTFAAKMGTDLTPGEAADLVNNWRAVNPEVVAYWGELDQALNTMASRSSPTGSILYVPVGPRTAGYAWRFSLGRAPESLSLQTGRTMRTLQIELRKPTGEVWFTRRLHGFRMEQGRMRYYKPTSRKTGDLWAAKYVDPKTKQTRFFEIYGGKLAGILTQSLCREVFFDIAIDVQAYVNTRPNVTLIGQFHDELILDWTPHGFSDTLREAKSTLHRMMERQILPDFPMGAEVKSSYRYTK